MMPAPAHDCARAIMEVLPMLMGLIRGEMRRQRQGGMSLFQFRALGCVERCPGTSLSALAEQLGMTLPTMSKCVDGLVQDGLLQRQADARDRRRVTLAVTARGLALRSAARARVQTTLASRLQGLNQAQRRLVIAGLETLRPLLAFDHVDCSAAAAPAPRPTAAAPPAAPTSRARSPRGVRR